MYVMCIDIKTTPYARLNKIFIYTEIMLDYFQKKREETMNALIKEWGMHEIQSWYGMDYAQLPEIDDPDRVEQDDDLDEELNQEKHEGQGYYMLSMEALGMSNRDFF